VADRLARVLSGLALVGVLGDTALLWKVHRDVTAIAEPIEAAVARHAEKTSARGEAPRLARATAEDAPRVAKEPDPDKQQRREEVASQWRDAVLDEIAAWGQEEGLDQATVDAVTDELVGTVQAIAAIRDDLRAERIQPTEARQEMRETKDDSDARLDQLVGKERADALRERLRDTRPF
jgi:hypothetical protein